MRYISDDDYKRIMKKMVDIDHIQIFSSEKDCLEHEKALAVEREKNKVLLAEKNRRRDEVKKLGSDFINLHKKYVDDYGEEIAFDNNLESPFSYYRTVPFWFGNGRLI